MANDKPKKKDVAEQLADWKVQAALLRNSLAGYCNCRPSKKGLVVCSSHLAQSAYDAFILSELA